MADGRSGLDLAIVGIGCRFPGDANTPKAFWEQLISGGEVVSAAPEGRWASGEQLAPARFGAFLNDVETFDADFFGISPREADSMDPQQRLLLELCYEALEHAQIPVASLRGTPTGVFVGISSDDYSVLQHQQRVAPAHYSATGRAHSVAAGRVSYQFGFEGPCMAVDTACSSSLVAVHLAAQSLTNGECNVALVGGVNLMLSPDLSHYFATIGALSSTGRCRTFDEAADGYVRGEGGAVIVLKRLQDALAGGDHVIATVQGTAVNQDGRSAGLTAPNGPSQERVIRQALARAAISPDDVGYIEAHGTGTPLGDPIELQALARVFGGRRTTRLPIGSVKTNIGHLEAAAGIAGLIKAALMLQHGTLVKHRHFSVGTKKFRWDRGPLVVQTSTESWTPGARPLHAGISSFGLSGTNAHVILAQGPVTAETHPEPEVGPWILPISAKSAGALDTACAQYESVLGRGVASVSELCAAAARGRDHHPHRLAAVGNGVEELLSDLKAQRSNVRKNPGATRKRRTVFVYSGQGSQWIGMGRGLLGLSAARAALEECDAVLREHRPWSLIDRLLSGNETDWLQTVDDIQPAIFAMQVAISAQMKAWGIHPDGVIGHSMGEIAAAYVSGRLSLADAVRVVCVRSELVKRVAGQGGIAAIELGAEEIEARLRSFDGKLSVAADNGPRMCLVAGDAGALGDLVAELDADGIFARRVNVDYASHCFHMDSLRGDLMEQLRTVQAGPGECDFYSSVHPDDEPLLDAAYWVENLCRPVRFADAVATALNAGVDLFVEVSPHPGLTAPLSDILFGPEATAQTGPSVVSSLRRGSNEQVELLRAISTLYENGLNPDWPKLTRQARRAELPVYPWQRKRYWFLNSVVGAPPRQAAGHVHPFLSEPDNVPADAGLWMSPISADAQAQPWLLEHVVGEQAVAPAALWLEVAAAAARQVGQSETVSFADARFPAFLELGADFSALRVCVSGTTARHAKEILIASRTDADAWTNHFQARLTGAQVGVPAELLPALLARLSREATSVVDLYAQLAQKGLQYGASFRGVQHAWSTDTEALAYVRMPEGKAGDFEYVIGHPALLDACLHAIACLKSEGEQAVSFVPVAFERMTVLRPIGRAAHCHVRLIERRPTQLTVDVCVFHEDGNPAVLLHALKLGATTRPVQDIFDAPMQRLGTAWRAVSQSVRAPLERRWMVLGDTPRCVESVRSQLLARAAQVATCDLADDPREQFERARDALAQSSTNALLVLLQRWPDQSVGQLEVCIAELSRLLGHAAAHGVTRVVLASRAGQCVSEGDIPAPGAAALWGWARTAALELPALNLECLDLGAEDVDAQALVDALGIPGEPFVALRSGHVFAPRLVPWSLEGGMGPETTDIARDQNYALETRETGTLDGLHLRACARPAPGVGEVEIEVASGGLNFRDVLMVMGAVPDEIAADSHGMPRLGAECAGRVTRVGPGVEGLAVGDSVVALAKGAFRRYALVDSRLVVAKPSTLSLDEAAASPVAFVTAMLALEEVAKVKPGERVLIHSAAGGLGQAAIQVALRNGARVFATASTPEKRTLLASLGAEFVSDSRSLAFVDEIRTHTQGGGVDVVVNSLSGEFMEASIRLLADGGRFVELGKRDCYEDRRIGLRPFLRNLSFSLVDLAQLCVDKPELVRSALLKITSLLATGGLRPPALKVHEVSDAAAVFRLMLSGGHTGKLLLRMPAEVRASSAPHDCVVENDGTFVISGGLGALGFHLAQVLVERGVRSLALLSRSSASDEHRSMIEELRRKAIVESFQCDVCDADAVAQVFHEIQRKMRPVRGIAHLAGVLDDATLESINLQKVRNVFAPKVLGARHLDAVARTLGVRHFLLYSSAAGTLGSPGQAHYGAANAYLDALAVARCREGLPGLSLAWGPWAGIGLAAKDSQRGARLADRGVTPIEPGLAAEQLSDLLGSRGSLTLAALQRGALDAHFASTHLSSYISELSNQPQAHPTEVTAELSAVSAEGRPAVLQRMLTAIVSVVLRKPESEINPDIPLMDYGLDSMMALEFRNRIRAQVGLQLSAPLIWKYPRLRELSVHLASLVERQAPTTVERKEHAANREATSIPSRKSGLALVPSDDLVRTLEAELAAVEARRNHG